MWFIYLWAFAIVVGFISNIVAAVRLKSKMEEITNKAAKVIVQTMTPVVTKAVTDLVAKESAKKTKNA